MLTASACVGRYTKRPMIEAASVSFHPADMAPLDLTYNRNVVLITDW
jgi:hypothetical protein